MRKKFVKDNADVIYVFFLKDYLDGKEEADTLEGDHIEYVHYYQVRDVLIRERDCPCLYKHLEVESTKT